MTRPAGDEELRAAIAARIRVRRAELARQPVSASRRAWRGRPGRFLRFAVVVVMAVAFAVSLREYVVTPFWIPSESMEPTLHGCATCRPDRLLVDKLSYHLHAVHRGDVIVFDRPANLDVNDAHLVKRVVGLAGESVSAHGGSVYINGRALAEPYVNPVCHGTADFAAVTVPSGDVFVMGDNRCDSLDSRVFGPISTSLIVGRAFVIVWPLGRLHWL